MIRFAVVRDGSVIGVGTCEEADLDAHVMTDGDQPMEAAAEVMPGWSWTADGGFAAPVAARPALGVLRAARKAEATAYRDQRQGGGCMTPLGRVDTDAERSLPLITGAGASALAALTLGLPFAPVRWTMADNSQVAHDARQIIAMGMAVTAHVDACQQACVGAKARLDAATDPDALAAVDVTAGYPA